MVPAYADGMPRGIAPAGPLRGGVGIHLAAFHDHCPLYLRATRGAGARRDQQLLKEKQEEKSRLEHRVAWLQSPMGAVEESRRKGMVYQGEHAVIFPLAATDSQLDPTAAALSTTLAARVWRSVPVSLALFVSSLLLGMGWLVRRRRLAHIRHRAGTLTTRSQFAARPDGGSEQWVVAVGCCYSRPDSRPVPNSDYHYNRRCLSYDRPPTTRTPYC